MAGDMIVVFGGSGFIGRYVVRALAKRGKRVRVAMRQPHLGQELRVLGGVGQIQLVQANVRYPESIDRALDGADGVVNLVGLMFEKGKQNFFNLHAEGAATIAAMADKREIDRFVQISAIGAGANNSRYAKTKAEGEEAVRTAIPSATIIRPSIVFGPEDKFFNRFAGIARFAPFQPLLGGRSRYQPVYAGDLAEAIANALDLREARGKVFEVGGPRVYSMKQLQRFILDTIMRKRPLIGLPLFLVGPIATLIATLCRLSPLPITPPLTGDQVTLLGKDNIVSEGALTIADLGVTTLESIEAIVPTYLWRFRPHGQFEVKQAV
jgi:NADH dehydrogenase